MSNNDVDNMKIKQAKDRIKRNGGKIGSQKNIYFRDPGLKVLAAIDCLVNYGGYNWRKR